MDAGLPKLEVLDGPTLVTISFDDLVKYHGRASIGGLALGFKALERALAVLSPHDPAARRDVEVQVAFDGPGSRDAFEMVTRAVTGNRYSVVPGLAGPDAPEAPEGNFVFRLAYRGAAVELTLRPGLVGEDFNALVRKDGRSRDEEELLVRMKEDLAARLLALPADHVFDCKVA